MRRALPVLTLILLAAPAAAQPPRQQIVGDLAYAIGQSHALRQLCRGDDDQYWRRRMQHILDIEAADEASRTTFADAFNAGFRETRTRHARCNADSRAAARAAATGGETLAARLRRATVARAPDSMAPAPASR